jgi:hypothetical protein
MHMEHCILSRYHIDQTEHGTKKSITAMNRKYPLTTVVSDSIPISQQRRSLIRFHSIKTRATSLFLEQSPSSYVCIGDHGEEILYTRKVVYKKQKHKSLFHILRPHNTITYSFVSQHHHLPFRPTLTLTNYSLQNPQSNLLTTPIRSCRRPQCNKRRRMLPSNPYSLLWHTFPHNFHMNIPIL